MKILHLLFLSFFIFQIAYSQQPCAPTIYEYPREGLFTNFNPSFKVAATADGGSIICGSKDGNNEDADAYLIKVDLLGNVMWEQTYGDTLNDSANAVLQTPDGGYIVIGSTRIDNGNNTSTTRIYLFKTNSNGVLEWERIIGPDQNAIYSSGADVKILPNGDLLIVGTVSLYEFNPNIFTQAYVNKMMIQKLDNMGNAIQTIYSNPSIEDWWSGDIVPGRTSGIGVNLMEDGSYIFTGTTGPASQVSPTASYAFAVKTDADLNIVWENTLSVGGVCTQGHLMNIVELDGFYYGSIYLKNQCYDGSSGGSLIKLDLDGNELWKQYYWDGIARKLIVTNDDKLAMGFNNTLMKLDTTGAIIWQANKFPMRAGNKNSLYQNSDGGFTLSGFQNNFQALDKVILLVTDSLGNNCSNFIEGNVFWDKTDNCLLDSTETTLKNMVVTVEPGPIHQLTDADGFYKIPVDTGTYTVTVDGGLNELWEQTCIPSYEVHFDTIYQTEDSLDFTFNTLFDCPLMNITANILGSRVCKENFICLPYCNDGTTAAEDVSIDLILNDDLSITDSPVPFTQTGNVYTFEIGDVAAGEGETLYLTSFLSCDAVLGDTICIEANILPNEDCGSLSSNSTDTHCRAVTNSFDPNDKQAIVDLDKDCLTEETAEIDYLIRFQNTGNDTAYRVYITDQISKELDLTSIRTIGNSHPYEWEIVDNNTIVWTFNNINLVDSTTSQIASQGFIQFKIAPQPGIDINTTIENEANIYFDYNDPILTNKVVLEHCDFTPFQNIQVNNADPSDCDMENGMIAIQVETDVEVAYSIDAGTSWQTQNEFLDLAPGEYHILIRDDAGEHIEEYENNPIIISAKTPPQITNTQITDPSNDTRTNGTITIIAEGNQPLEYSIDNGMTWQTTNFFEGLTIGNYQILIRYEDQTCQIISNEFSLLESVATNNLNSFLDFDLVPNPATDNIYLTIQSPSSRSLHLSIVNSNGDKISEEVLGTPSNLEKVIDISEFPNGVYILTISDGFELSYKKFLVY